MTGSIIYDYEHRVIDAKQAKRILGSTPGGMVADNPHFEDDACLIWEPIRLVYDKDGRLLAGTDELRHIMATRIPLDAAVYREPRDRERDEPKQTKTVAPKETKPVSLRQRVIGLLREEYPMVGNAVNWTGVATRLARPNASYEDVKRMLSHMDVKAEYEWYRLAIRIQRDKTLHLPAVDAAVLMHRQAENADPTQVRAFWEELADKESGLHEKAVKAGRDGIIRLMADEWKRRDA